MKFKVGDVLKRTDFSIFSNANITKAYKEFRIKVIFAENNYYRGLVTVSDDMNFVKQGTIIPFNDGAPFEVDSAYEDEEML